MKVIVEGAVFEESPDAVVHFQAGLDALGYFEPGSTFHVRCEVVERDGEAMMKVRPVAVAADQE